MYWPALSIGLLVGNLTGTQLAGLEATVSSASPFIVVPGDVLDRLGMPRARRQRFQLADGQIVEHDVGDARVQIDGKECVTAVIFAEPNEPSVVGRVVLVSLLLRIDSAGQRLIPVVGRR